ncbi:MAG: serine/threonine protein kinase, partial [Candidatus Obscuribacterales bacterium]|nr:serine/threonine protein kinase [Candidatus Obscuribacterales bacterium]
MDLLKPGQLFHDRYLINEKIGSGGMGTVYRATQTNSQSQVAIKILNTSLLSSKEQRERFLREFRILSRISNEHIVSFYNAAISPEGLPYAVFEYIDGITLSKLLNSEISLPWQRCLLIIKQVCAAIEAAHSTGIIHRDLKPDNIMLLSKPYDDFVKVVDFGLARSLTHDEVQKLTSTGELIGSIHYMSPEQCAGQPVDQRSDIYAIACILFECLTGELLFNADSAIGILHLHSKADPSDRLKLLEGRCPQTLIEIIAKMLEKRPENRYATISELMAEIYEIPDDETITISSPIHLTKKNIETRSARFNLIVAAAIISPLIMFALWLALTDSGMLLQAKISLTNNPSKSNASYWVSRFDSLLSSGKYGEAKELATEISNVISSKVRNPYIAAEIFLDLAQSSKDETESINLAINAFKQIAKGDQKDKTKTTDLISAATQIIKNHAKKLTVPQIKELNKINGVLVSIELYNTIFPELRKR